MNNEQYKVKTIQLENSCYITGPNVDNKIVGKTKFFAPTQCQNCTGYDEYEGYYNNFQFVGIIKILRSDGSLSYADARIIKIGPTNETLNSIANTKNCS